MSEAQELLEIVLLHGSEDHVAERVERLRKDRGWSQEQLARKVTEAGCPMPQSAISRMEKPPAGGRRAVTVDELLALARAFEVGILDLLLPPAAFAERELIKDLRLAPERLAAARQAFAEYEAAAERIVAELRTNAHWRERLAEGLVNSTTTLAQMTDEDPGRPRAELYNEFYRRILAETEPGGE